MYLFFTNFVKFNFESLILFDKLIKDVQLILNMLKLRRKDTSRFMDTIRHSGDLFSHLYLVDWKIRITFKTTMERNLFDWVFLYIPVSNFFHVWDGAHRRWRCVTHDHTQPPLHCDSRQSISQRNIHSTTFIRSYHGFFGCADSVFGIS